jgi:hypothetical protein
MKQKKSNGTACFVKCKQLLEYQNLILLSDICGLYYKNILTIVSDDRN